MKRVLLDVDGVIADYTTAFLDAYMKCGGDAVSMSDVTDFDFEVCLPRCRALREYIQSYTHAPGFALTLAPYPRAIKAVCNLMEMAEVVFVTSPLNSRTWAHDRTQWLKNHFGDPVTIVSTKHKHLVKGDFLIDDNAENVRSWLDAWPEGEGIVWEQPWNAHTKLFRTRDWNDVFEAVK